MQGESVKRCIECGEVLTGTKRKFCGRECCDKYRLRMLRKKTRERQLSGEEDVRNRPYTEETGWLIRKWHEEGTEIDVIAEILGRSIQNVMLAFMEDDCAAETADGGCGLETTT